MNTCKTGFRVFQTFLLSCALYKSSLSIERVKNNTSLKNQKGKYGELAARGELHLSLVHKHLQ